VIGAVFGGRSAKSRDATMRMLLTRALLRASPVRTRRVQPVLIAQPRAARPAAAPAPRQAQAIAAPPPAAPAPARRLAAVGFEVQIGAFNSTAEAERALSQARGATGGLLEAYPARTFSIEKGNRLFYRARFSGFSADVATATCLALRRQRIDCFVSRAE
jgi:D-alanyl-D-alanine carboxypeptidase